MALLQFQDVTHHYVSAGKHLLTLDGINLTLERGEFVALIGASGSGKSTLVKLAAGLEQPSSGEIRMDGRAFKQRLGKTAYMPQADGLLPWRTVLDNVVLGSEIQRGRRTKQIRQQAVEMLRQFGLAGFEEVYPAQLSGGMRQRAAFLRTFMMEQELVLLDEPLSALDAFTRAEIQDWLLNVREHFNRTILLVTHDVQEAVYLADRVIVLSARPGRIVGNVRVDLPHPRDRSSFEFHQVVTSMIEQIAQHTASNS